MADKYNAKAVKPVKAAENLSGPARLRLLFSSSVEGRNTQECVLHVCVSAQLTALQRRLNHQRKRRRLPKANVEKEAPGKQHAPREPRKAGVWVRTKASRQLEQEEE